MRTVEIDATCGCKVSVVAGYDWDGGYPFVESVDINGLCEFHSKSNIVDLLEVTPSYELCGVPCSYFPGKSCTKKKGHYEKDHQHLIYDSHRSPFYYWDEINNLERK